MPMNADAAARSDSHVQDEQLVQLIDGELDADEQRSVRDHIDGCAACAKRLGRLRRLSTDANAAYRINAQRARVAKTLISLAATVVALVWIGLRDASPWGDAQLGMQTGPLPVQYLTPGVRRTVTAAELCHMNDEADTREIPASVRHAVLLRYGAGGLLDRDFELDYLITPELGGAMDAQNLWPERYASAIWNAHVKDDLEQLLRRLVCSGSVPLDSAQRDIARNWIAAYKHYFRTDRPGGWPATLPRPLPLRE
jgi:hypothetical protein